MIIIEKKKQVMHNTAAHHLLPNARSHSQAHISLHDVFWSGTSLWTFGQGYLSQLCSQFFGFFLCTSSLAEHETQNNP